MQDLQKLEENAKHQKKGMWNTEAKDKKRPMTKENTPTEIFERLKGTAQNGLCLNDILCTEMMKYSYCRASAEWTHTETQSTSFL